MRTLFIEYSYLVGNGGGIYAARSHVNLFAHLSSYMTLVYPAVGENSIDGIATSRVSELCPILDRRLYIEKMKNRISGWFTRYSVLDSSIFDPNQYDVVVFDNSAASAHLIDIAKDKGLKVVTIHHNYQVEYLKGDGNILTRPLDIFWTKINESKAVRLSNLNIVLTPDDAVLLSNHYDKDAAFQVLGVCEYEPRDLIQIKPKKRDHRYLITGGLSSRQNEESIIRWIKRYYPVLLQYDPKAILTIAGRGPSKHLANFLNHRGINLIGSPVDMYPILQESDYYICPVDCGGGLKLKIMDGLKAGLPIITHKVSARGYEPMAKSEVLFDYFDEKSFLRAIDKANNCSKSNQEIMEIYKSIFSFECGVKRLENILINSSLL